MTQSTTEPVSAREQSVFISKTELCQPCTDKLFEKFQFRNKPRVDEVSQDGLACCMLGCSNDCINEITFTLDFQG